MARRRKRSRRVRHQNTSILRTSRADPTFYIVEMPRPLTAGRPPAPDRIPPLPRLPAALLHTLLPRAERDEVLEDLAAEYREHASNEGEAAARRWLWRQALGSAPALMRWTWWRGWTGFEPRANAFRPGEHMLTNWFTDAR